MKSIVKKTASLNNKQLRQLITEKYRFISQLEEYCNFPDCEREGQDKSEENDVENTKSNTGENNKQKKPVLDVTKRLRGLEEIELKLKEIKGKKMSNIKEMKYKKNLKTRLNKQKKGLAFKRETEMKKQKKMELKQVKREAFQNGTVIEEEKVTENGNSKSDVGENEEKIIFNKGDKMVFNRINFSGLGQESRSKKKNKKNKTEKDPKQILENLKKSKSEIDNLEKSGDNIVAKKLKEKHLWMSALKRAEGIKVKDDVELLKKSIKKQKETKNRQQKKWEARVQAVEKRKEDRQKKRRENIATRKQERKKNKMKRVAKKGRVIL